MAPKGLAEEVREPLLETCEQLMGGPMKTETLPSPTPCP